MPMPEMTNARRSAALFAAAVLTGAASQAAVAADMSQTPHYSHALHQLQFARFLLADSSGNESADQRHALDGVDRAIAELKSARIVDTSELGDNERAMSTRTRQERLNAAVNAMYAARFDVTRYSEINAPREGWRSRVESDLSTAEAAARSGAALPQTASATPAPGTTSPPATTIVTTRKPGGKGGFRPSYLYAIRDLDYAEKILAGPDLASDTDVQAALGDIRSAAGSFKQAAIDDGRDLNGKANVDANMSHMDRLHSVLALLRQVHTDVSRRETNEAASDMESTAISHVDSAAEHVKLTIARNDRAKH